MLEIRQLVKNLDLFIVKNKQVSTSLSDSLELIFEVRLNWDKPDTPWKNIHNDLESQETLLTTTKL